MINELYPAPSTTEEDAFALVRAATNISRARKQNDAAALTVALDENLQLWTAIQTLMEKKDHPLPAQTKENLLKLAKFVVAKTVSEGCEASDKTLDTLENMNLQIARGLMESIRLPPVKENAAVLIQTAQRLADAAKNNDKNALIEALDTNLHLWIALKTLAETKRLGTDDAVAANIARLAKYVSEKTFECGADISEETLSGFININMQIAEGFLESKCLSGTEEDALALLRAALMLAEAKDKNDQNRLVEALNNNMELWTGIKTLVSAKNHPLAKEIKDNLVRLADFSIGKTFEIGANTAHKTIDTLININLQISEGLLERVKFAA